MMSISRSFSPLVYSVILSMLFPLFPVYGQINLLSSAQQHEKDLKKKKSKYNKKDQRKREKLLSLLRFASNKKLQQRLHVDETRLAANPLQLNGTGSTIEFDIEGGALRLRRLLLNGNSISDANQVCWVDATSQEVPLTLTRQVLSSGLPQYSTKINNTCTLTFSPLQEAILVPSTVTTCRFEKLDCQVPLSGVWGPVDSFTPEQIKALNQEMGYAVKDMRNYYKALIFQAESFGHGRKRTLNVQSVARDQAAFSSTRELTCRDYKGEDMHNFCSTKLTQRRVLELSAQLNSAILALNAPNPPTPALSPLPSKGKQTAQMPPELLPPIPSSDNSDKQGTLSLSSQ